MNAIFANAFDRDSNLDTHGSGAYLVCLGVPEATEFGLDYEVFRTGPKFQGVKFVPLGLHLVIFCSREHDHGIRQGFFINVERHGQVIVREWSNETEELQSVSPALNIENLERAVRSFQLDSGLGAYPMQHFKIWSRMTNFITESVLKRCGIEFGALLLPGDAEDTHDNPSGVIPYFVDAPRVIQFTKPLQENSTKNMTTQERTMYHFDKSENLENLVRSQYQGDWKELLGEFQLAFVAFLQLSSLTAFEQWKKLLILLCSCERALTLHTDLFLALMKVLRIQLRQIPVDFFEDGITAENFLRPTLMSFLELLMDDETPVKLREKGLRLQQLLHSRFNIDFGIEQFENAEFAPLIIPPEELGLNIPYVDDSNDSTNEAIALAFLASSRDNSNM